MRSVSIGFHCNNANLRRISLLELIEDQLRRANKNEVKLSLVVPPCEIEAKRQTRQVAGCAREYVKRREC